MNLRCASKLLCLLCALSLPLAAQTTQGLISGRLVSTVTGQGVPGAIVEYSSTSSTKGGTAPADASGYYTLPLLSPGVYRVRVVATGFQAQEVQDLELPVAARLELDFRMRPLTDVWETGQFNSVFLPGSRTIVTFFGPDVDTSRSGSFEATKGRTGALESTVSEVISSELINRLPLEGRDVYTLLITQPGITSDAATGRGLGLSTIGQRPSATNFLLDGVENNNYLITGPLVIVAPEAIQEYRISTNNFSAEYGRTSGFLANAITRAGTDQFHGTAYFYIKNDVLNANTFQSSLNYSQFLAQLKPFLPAAAFAQYPASAPRTPLKEIQPGFVIGGPLFRNRLYASSAGEYFRSRSFDDPQIFDFLTPGFLDFAQPTSDSYKLMTKYPSPKSYPTPTQLTGITAIAPPVELNRRVYIERLDYIPGSKDHLTGRVIVNRLGEPDFIWTPFPDFVSALRHNTINPAVTETHNFRPGLTNEARVSYSDDDLHWNRPHPEIPTLAAADANAGFVISLPGSPAFYEYKNVNRSGEFVDNVIWAKGRHLITAGGGFLARRSGGFLTAGRDSQYLFSSPVFFGLDRPYSFSAPVDRSVLPTVREPAYDRVFQYRQFNLFVQDTWKLTARLTLNYGLRWEVFGGPRNAGRAKDTLVQLGSGADLFTQISGATVATPPPGSGDQQLFGTDYKDFAPRVGVSYDLFGKGRTLLRAAYGVFYDRPFDNLWENLRSNSFLLLQAALGPKGTGLQTKFISSPVASQLALLAPQTIQSNFPDLTVVDPKLRNGYAQSYFGGVQQRLTNDFTLEVNAAGSYGRRLITTDLVNRDFTTTAGRINPALTQDMSYRAAQGFSDYNALTAVARYRTSRGFLQTTYTWSHVIDNQSEPLLGDFFNLTFTAATAPTGPGGRAAFTKQFNPNIDRGNSDFDQRQNFIIFSYWDLPKLGRAGSFGRTLGWLTDGWGVSELAAFRSGFPYNIVAGTDAEKGLGEIANNRPNVLDPNAVFLAHPKPVPGGMQLLNVADFTVPKVSTLGNLGRNALTGPGFYNLDVSVTRAFPLRWLGETGRLMLRLDAYNVLNHANLGNPVTQLDSRSFGAAFFGRQGAGNGFPATSPLNETPRELQIALKVMF